MRDTGSREEQRQGAEQFTKRRQQQKEEDKKEGKQAQGHDCMTQGGSGL
jgi:hypothetical protein